MAKYRVRYYRELAGWIYVGAESSKKALSKAARGEGSEGFTEDEVSYRIGGDVEEVEDALYDDDGGAE